LYTNYCENVVPVFVVKEVNTLNDSFATKR
jgi:hypothetical protein